MLAPNHNFSSPLHQLYQARIDAGDITSDPLQAAAIDALAPLLQPRPRINRLQRWLGRRADKDVAGAYLHGSVGRGKTMMMDLFFQAFPSPRKKRVHFHDFMRRIHHQLHQQRQHGGEAGVKAGLNHIAQRMAAELDLLCFDEFHVVDVADAMILGRLFTALLDAGLLVVLTSNWPPARLYWNGLQRDRFLPFISLVESRLKVIALDGAVDYRYRRFLELQCYFTPLGASATAALEKNFAALIDGATVEAFTLQVDGREWVLERSAAGVAFTHFSTLCEQNLGAGDYLALAKHFRVLLLDGVPALRADQRNEAKRFMNLIDILYDAGVKTMIAANVRPERIYAEGAHAFEFQRTVSRLIEMQDPSFPLPAHSAANPNNPAHSAANSKNTAHSAASSDAPATPPVLPHSLPSS